MRNPMKGGLGVDKKMNAMEKIDSYSIELTAPMY